MKSIRICVMAAASIFALTVTNTFGVTIWNESTGGDLSGNRLAPSAVTLALGGNDLFATTANGDQEYLRVTVPTGHQLSSLWLRSYSGNDLVSFIAMQSGDTFTEAPATANPANLLGYAHFGPGRGNLGANILPQMGTELGAQGFTPPLPSGNYTFWLQQTGSAASYQFEFVTVPEPSSLVLLGVALSTGLIALRSVRRKNVG
jgi:hypothetical protein